MALTLKITPAGRAAMRNEAGDGTNAVRIAKVGVTATAIVSGAVVAGEIKRIATIAGGATSADTMHVTVVDAGTDVYSVRGFGYYLDNDVLFASYGQAAVIVEKSAQSEMQLGVDVKFEDVDASLITFGDTNFSNPAATTEVLGVVKLATDAATIAGIDPMRAVTPKGLLAALTARLGAGNPSAFVKSLLDKISALAFVTALGIRGAASYDTGPGNGLDADLLDGEQGAYYRDWGNLKNVPSSFPPGVHSHAMSDVSGLVTVFDAAAETTPAADYPSSIPSMGTVLWPTATGTTLTVPRLPSSRIFQILVPAVGGTNTPDMYLRASHDNVGGGGWTGFVKVHHTGNFNPATKLDTATFTAAFTWGGLPGKPSTFPPSGHSHAMDNVNGLTDALALRPVQTTITAQIVAAVNGVVNGSPGALDTLRELADAMGNDPNFAASVTNAIAGKQAKIPTSTSIDYAAPASTYSPAGVATIGVAGVGAWPAANATTLTINALDDIRTAQIMMSPTGGSQVPTIAFRTYHTSNGGGGWTVFHELFHRGNLNPDLYAPKDNPTFTGNGITVTGNAPRTTYVETDTGKSWSALLDAGSYTVREGSSIRFFIAAGAQRLDINSDGLWINGNAVWNTGNLNPNIFAPKASPSFTGTVTLATLAASGAITGASVRATGTIMAAGGFQIG